jgi:hypothetical protein
LFEQRAHLVAGITAAGSPVSTAAAAITTGDPQVIAAAAATTLVGGLAAWAATYEITRLRVDGDIKIAEINANAEIAKANAEVEKERRHATAEIAKAMADVEKERIKAAANVDIARIQASFGGGEGKAGSPPASAA